MTKGRTEKSQARQARKSIRMNLFFFRFFQHFFARKPKKDEPFGGRLPVHRNPSYLEVDDNVGSDNDEEGREDKNPEENSFWVVSLCRIFVVKKSDLFNCR